LDAPDSFESDSIAGENGLLKFRKISGLHLHFAFLHEPAFHVSCRLVWEQAALLPDAAGFVAGL